MKYTQNEELLDSVIYLFGAKKAEALTFDIGIYEFNFSCLIPPEMPYSIDKSTGYIKCAVYAKLYTSRICDYKAFTVYRREDLNLFPKLNEPKAFEKIATFCSFSRNTANQLSMTMHLSKTGFTRGEKVPVTITLVNDSNTDILGTTLILRRIFTFYVKSHTKQKIEDLKSISCEGVKRGQRATFDAEIVVPETLLYTSAHYCQTIKVSYRLDLRAHTNGIFSTSLV